MIAWVVSLGSWSWFILAVLLFLLEALAPGMFMLWLGLSAIVIGVVSSVIALSWRRLCAYRRYNMAGDRA